MNNGGLQADPSRIDEQLPSLIAGLPKAESPQPSGVMEQGNLTANHVRHLEGETEQAVQFLWKEIQNLKAEIYGS